MDIKFSDTGVLMSKISLRSLKAFVAVFEEQSFSKAAERLNATQSGMSTQVKNLEHQLGKDLLRRDRNSLKLTDAGKIVYENGLQILKKISATEQLVEELNDEYYGDLNIGLIPALTRTVFTHVIDEFKTLMPNVNVILTEEYSGSLLSRVNSGILDFAVVPSSELPQGLSSTYIESDREFIVSAPQTFDSYSHLESIPFSKLQNMKLIVPSEANVRRKRINSLLSAHNINPAELLEMDGMLGTIELIAVSDWITILPSAICFPDMTGKIRKLNPIIQPKILTDYILVQKADRILNGPARKFKSLIMTVVKDVVYREI